MITENSIVIDRTKPTNLSKLNGKRRGAVRVELMGREHHELPAQIASIQLVFFNNINQPIKVLDFISNPGVFLPQFFPYEEYIINADYCQIYNVVGQLLDKEQVVLFYNPPLTT